MKIKLLLVVIILLVHTQVFCQNCPPHDCSDYIQPECELVRDGGMEYFPIQCLNLEIGGDNLYRTCFWKLPLSSGTTNDGSTEVGSSDYFNACAPYPITAPNSSSTVYKSANPRRNWTTLVNSDCNTCLAHGGCGYSGISVFSSGGSGTFNSREYICNQLSQPLEPGETYQVSMWVKLAPRSEYGVKDLHVFFSPNQPLQPIEGGIFPGLIPTTNGSVVVMSTGQHLVDKTQWTKLTATFTAPAGSNYSWITIGNFNSNFSTSVSASMGWQLGLISYYYIDDVSVSCPIVKPDPCCQNTLPVWTDVPVPQSFPFSDGTVSVEDFNIHAPGNSIPITEIKVTVEDFALISSYENCISCNISPALLGSVFSSGNIGTGTNILTTQPYPAPVSLQTNNNEIIWKNDNGAMLNAPDRISVMYILPQGSGIPCCADSAKICIRITYRDTNCGICEVHNCTTVPLRTNRESSPTQKNQPLPTLKEVATDAGKRIRDVDRNKK